MTEKELTAMKAVLHLAMNNPHLRAEGIWVEDVNHYETCSKIKFTEAIGIVGELLYGSNIEKEGKKHE